MGEFRSFKDSSRDNYGKSTGLATTEEVKVGCFQRIADATEAMATNFLKLQSDNEYLKNRNKNLVSENEKLRKSISAYKGQITKLKKNK